MRETLLRMPADIPILTVCDREGDFYEFFSEAADLKANFLIRIVQNRMVDDGKKIFHELRSSPVAEAWLSDEPESQRAYPIKKYKNGLPLQKGYNLPSSKEKGKAFTGKAGADSDLCA